jgi:large-conductance mechanosensitive channel
MLKEFKQFALKGNMVDLAAGLVLGAAAGAATVNYGASLNTVVHFLIVAWALFFLVKSVNAARLTPEAPAPTERKCGSASGPCRSAPRAARTARASSDGTMSAICGSACPTQARALR